MRSCLVQYFRCPEQYDRIASGETPSTTSGFFRFGRDSICFGRYHAQQPASVPAEALHDALAEVVIEDGKVCLTFDPSQVVENLHQEAYIGEWRAGSLLALSRIYYFLRPALPVFLRRHLQMLHLGNWRKLSFPSWPVDCSVDNLLELLMLQSLRASGEERIPFIWFWPDGCSSCAIITHDVETQAGFAFCPTLMDVDDAFGIKASFQIIPEERYRVHSEFLEEIRRRGFEVCVHDLNHDGHLYKNREQFLKRAARINAHGKEFGAEGFRAAVLYRKQLWYDALDFSYDMSVPNVAHLDPQRGGCCTVMPYFLNGILEIPVTTIQDYSLFNILKDYSISLWKQQTKIIMEKHGCMSFIVHPDYVMQPRALGVFKELLAHLDRLRSEENVWITIPREVNRWWRQRAAMRLVKSPKGWRIEGEGAERARIAWASEKDGYLVFSVEKSASNISVPTEPTPITARPSRYSHAAAEPLHLSAAADKVSQSREPD
jgi:hypothetical protein